MKPICAKCRRFYKPEKNGVWFLEGMPTYNGAPPGLEEPEAWVPYKLWRGDLWKCRGCGHEIISSVAAHPVCEHYQPGFKKAVDAFQPIFQVNDC
jgi:hypothetical protein